MSYLNRSPFRKALPTTRKSQLLLGALVLIAPVLLSGCMRVYIAELDDALKNYRANTKHGSDRIAELSSTEERFGGFKMRPPKAFQRMDEAKQGNRVTYTWALDRASGSSSAGRMMIMDAPLHSLKDQADENKLNLLYKSTLVGMSVPMGMLNFKQEDPEPVEVNGAKFLRGRWANAHNDLIMLGFCYITAEPGREIVITGISNDLPTLETIEASALTFKK